MIANMTKVEYLMMLMMLPLSPVSPPLLITGYKGL